MRSRAIETFRRSELERWIDAAIDLLNTMDGDPDFEEGGDADWSGYVEELPTRRLSGDGVPIALRMIAASPAASKRANEYADSPRLPLIYDFRRGASR